MKDSKIEPKGVQLKNSKIALKIILQKDLISAILNKNTTDKAFKSICNAKITRKF